MRKTAKARGITLKRGASRDDIADALLGHLREALAGKGDDDEPGGVPKPAKKAPVKKAAKKPAGKTVPVADLRAGDYAKVEGRDQYGNPTHGTGFVSNPTPVRIGKGAKKHEGFQLSVTETKDGANGWRMTVVVDDLNATAELRDPPSGDEPSGAAPQGAPVKRVPARKKARDLTDSTDPRDNAEKVERLLDEDDEGPDFADLYRKIEYGPSGQRKDHKVGRVRRLNSGPYDLAVVDPKTGDHVGFITRDGDEWTVTAEGPDGALSLKGRASTPAVAADVLVSDEHSAMGRHNSRRLDGGKFRAHKPAADRDESAAKLPPAKPTPARLSDDPAVREVQVENRIREAYQERLADGPGGWVPLASIREALPDIDRDELDAALTRTAIQPGAHVIPWDNIKALTKRDHDAALRIGGNDSHVIRLEDPSPRPLPDTAPRKRAPAKKAAPTAEPDAPDADADIRSLDPEAARRVRKSTKGATIGDVVLGPTQAEVALGLSDAPLIFGRDYGDHPLAGADGVITHRGSRLPEGFTGTRAEIYAGRFAQRPGLSPEENRALDLYVLSSVADPLNSSLRSGNTTHGTVKTNVQGNPTVDLDEVASNLDAAIAAGELAEDTNLYRGSLMRPVDVGKLQPGAITAESGYLSTSTDRQSGHEIIGWRREKGAAGSSPVLFKIRAPAGTHAAVGHVEENEVLLGRGRQMRVVDVLRPTRKGDVRVVTVEPLPEATDPTDPEAARDALKRKAKARPTLHQEMDAMGDALAQQRELETAAGTRRDPIADTLAVLRDMSPETARDELDLMRVADLKSAAEVGGGCRCRAVSGNWWTGWWSTGPVAGVRRRCNAASGRASGGNPVRPTRGFPRCRDPQAESTDRRADGSHGWALESYDRNYGVSTWTAPDGRRITMSPALAAAAHPYSATVSAISPTRRHWPTSSRPPIRSRRSRTSTRRQRTLVSLGRIRAVATVHG